MATPGTAAVGGKITAGWANIVAAVAGDTGWINISASFNNSFTAGTQTPQYRIIGSTCYLRGDYYRSTAPTSNTAAQTLPPAAFPTAEVVETTRNPDQIDISLAGVISVLSSAARTGGLGYSLTGIDFLIN